ncbi:MAG: twin-arginine translocation signal domain-containing protein [Pseudomonadota bacterium]
MKTTASKFPRVSRRDFLNGIAASAGTAAFCPQALAQELAAFTELRTSNGDYYPPTLTGMRGSHEGSYEVAHALAWG